MSLRCSILLALACAGAATGLRTAPAAAEDFPRLGFYGSVHGDGTPYVIPATGLLDTTVIAAVSRFDDVILDVNPVSPYRPDIVLAMKQRHPGMRAIAYVLGGDYYPDLDADSLNQIPTLIYRMLRHVDGFLYDRNTGLPIDQQGTNLAKKDASGRFVVADSLAILLRDHVIAAGIWDGIFTDIFPHTVGWIQNGTSTVIDYARAGYPSLAALDLAWSQAADTLASRLRAYGGPNFVLIGNSGLSAEHAWYNGWMREDFPFQEGGTWYSNMLTDPQGYFADDRDFQPAPHNFVFSAWDGTANPYDAANTRSVRYGLASAALGESYACFGPPDKNSSTAPYQNWWYDEYGVDVATGRASTSAASTHWLGRAVNDHYQMIWVGTNPDASANPGFDAGTTGWSFASFSPAVASFAQDTTTSAVGRGSGRVRITTASTVDWHVSLTTAGTIPMTPGLDYAATFWCKASPPRVLRLVAYNSGGGAYVQVDSTWRQYQAIVTTGASNGAVQLAFWLGTEAGDVWLDDVHFQQGATSLYRRDFQNGSVLVNPADATLTVPLGRPFQRILGVADPTVNNGATASSVTVPARDAVFLISTERDSIPPAAVTDLRAGP